MKKFSLKTLSLLVLFVPVVAFADDSLNEKREKVIASYADYLDHGQFDKMAGLFATDGSIDSPFLKETNPEKFYKAVAKKEHKPENVMLKEIFQNAKDPNTYAFRMTYTLKGERKEKSVQAVDIVEFLPDSDQIKTLTIFLNKKKTD